MYPHILCFAVFWSAEILTMQIASYKKVADWDLSIVFWCIFLSGKE